MNLHDRRLMNTLNLTCYLNPISNSYSQTCFMAEIHFVTKQAIPVVYLQCFIVFYCEIFSQLVRGRQKYTTLHQNNRKCVVVTRIGVIMDYDVFVLVLIMITPVPPLAIAHHAELLLMNTTRPALNIQ